MAMPRQFSKRHVIDVLKRVGLTELAEEASRVLPDVVDADQLEEWALQRGISHDDLISRMGGSP